MVGLHNTVYIILHFYTCFATSFLAPSFDALVPRLLSWLSKTSPVLACFTAGVDTVETSAAIAVDRNDSHRTSLYLVWT